jgi:polyhydroxybutyrate depolymerase
MLNQLRGVFSSLRKRQVKYVIIGGISDSSSSEGQGRILLPVREWAAAWAARDGCDTTPKVTFQHGEVTGETWDNCRDGAQVTLYTIEGRGHSWPGSAMPPQITTRDVNATDVSWEFFAAHPMP